MNRLSWLRCRQGSAPAEPAPLRLRAARLCAQATAGETRRV